MENKDIDYICKDLLKIDWQPQLDAGVLRVLKKCDSKLEVMFILGACNFINTQSDNDNWITTSEVRHNGGIYTGIWYSEPWMGWYLEELPQHLQSGPSALLFVPQLKSAEKNITHDLALFYGDDNGSPKWMLRHIIEIDGYGVHKERREKDKLRDKGLSYPVNRFYEETDNPLEWFRSLVYKDVGWNGS